MWELVTWKSGLVMDTSMCTYKPSHGKDTPQNESPDTIRMGLSIWECKGGAPAATKYHPFANPQMLPQLLNVCHQVPCGVLLQKITSTESNPWMCCKLIHWTTTLCVLLGNADLQLCRGFWFPCPPLVQSNNVVGLRIKEPPGGWRTPTSRATMAVVQTTVYTRTKM